MVCYVAIKNDGMEKSILMYKVPMTGSGPTLSTGTSETPSGCPKHRWH